MMKKIWPIINMSSERTMSKIKEYFIHLLGGLTQNEHSEDVNSLTKAHEVILAKLNEKEERLQRNLNALEWAIEDSRMTGRVNVVRTEKPIVTFKSEVRLDLYYESLNMDKVSEEEVMRRARHVIVDKIANYLEENNLIDFRMSGEIYDNEQILSGTIYVREP